MLNGMQLILPGRGTRHGIGVVSAVGDTTILTENDSNDSKVTV
jgi:hypothetical protein